MQVRSSGIRNPGVNLKERADHLDGIRESMKLSDDD